MEEAGESMAYLALYHQSSVSRFHVSTMVCGDVLAVALIRHGYVSICVCVDVWARVLVCV